MEFFENLGFYEKYLDKYHLHHLFKIDLKNYGKINKKKSDLNIENISKNKDEPLPALLDDLIRLHYLVISRKVTTILEFGVGKSSIVFDDALKINKKNYFDFVNKYLRRTNAFECHSVDNNKKWIEVCNKTAKTSLVKYHLSKCVLSTFNGRICTFYEQLPNICPDLIYLDAPDQFSPIGQIRGIDTAHPDRQPMAGDILSIEHFLLPGTLIVVDGRSANARFLRLNLQRNWSYYNSEEFDQHFFELLENPLSTSNKRQVDFCLGNDFYKRLNKKNN